MEETITDRPVSDDAAGELYDRTIAASIRGVDDTMQARYILFSKLPWVLDEQGTFDFPKIHESLCRLRKTLPEHPTNTPYVSFAFGFSREAHDRPGPWVETFYNMTTGAMAPAILSASSPE